MEQQEALDRQVSRKQSKRSLWSRKSTKKQPAPTNTTNNALLGKLTSAMDSDPMLEKKWDDEKSDETREKSDQVSVLTSRSIIPDPLGELPAWFSKEGELVAGQTTSYRLRYPIHSPQGPRYYKNQHLIPNSILRPINRAPSLFSPQFPPMSASLHDTQEDSLKGELNRSPSGSPLATPDSSQADVAGKPRSRKTSQTTPDTVDLLDVTDPWGTHYHHPSPYDPGLGNSPVNTSPVDSPEVSFIQLAILFNTNYFLQASMSPRSRRSSLSANPRRKTITPSPLSQSTSALHIIPPSVGGQITPKVTKRRTPLIGGLFGGQDKQATEQADLIVPAPPASAPPAPTFSEPSMPTSPRSSTAPTNGGYEYPRRLSTAPPPNVSHNSAPMVMALPAEKKEKRGSVLGRMVKKLSIMRKPSANIGVGSVGSADESWQHISGTDRYSDRDSRRSLALPRPSLQEKDSMDSRKSEMAKRKSPPTLDMGPLASPGHGIGGPRKSVDRRSSISVEQPFATGKLTIANPDAPSSVDNTPVRPNITLPSEPEPEPMPKMPQGEDFVMRDSVVERRESLLPPLPHPDHGADRTSQATAIPVVSSRAPVEPASDQLRPFSGQIPMSPATDPMSLYPAYVDGLAPALTPAPASVPGAPFPTSERRPFSALSASARATIASSPSSFTTVDSPLSRASMLVNPPTPHNLPTAMPSVPAPSVSSAPPTPPAKPSVPIPEIKPERRSRTNSSKSKGPAPPSKADISKPKVMVSKPKVEPPKPSHEARPRGETPKPKPEIAKAVANAKPKVEYDLKDDGQVGKSAVPSRQTETFKLIRSPSGNVIPLSETITAAGEQWVVESSDSSKKNKPRERSSRSRERDNGNRREPKRQESAPVAAVDTDHRRASSRQKSFHGKVTEATSLPVPGNSTRSRSVDESRPPEQEGVKHARKDSNLNLNKPQPPPPPPTPGPSRLERKPSNSARPTSELPSTAELISIKAREAWEAERLRKGKSMHYGSQSGPGATAPDPRDSIAATVGTVTDLTRGGSVRSAGHGSSHTSYRVQPFQGQLQGPQIYANMPTGPPPSHYSAATSQQATFPPSTLYEHPSNTVYRSIPPSFPIPHETIPEPPSRSNPLPPPPQESSYQPAPLPSLSDSTRPSSDHWTKYPGITTAH